MNPSGAGVRRGVLYLVACGSPVSRHVGQGVRLAQCDGWEVCVITTPAGRKFCDPAALACQTGHPVRSSYKEPDDPDVLPAPNALLVGPATRLLAWPSRTRRPP